jgi:tetratricopeptide (TPR) repeat protein
LLDRHNVEPWTDEDAKGVFRTSPALRGASDEELTELVRLCGGLPLVLDQVASYVAKTGISVPGYSSLLDARRVDTMRAYRGPGTNLVEAIELALDKAGADACEILAMLSFVNPGPFVLDAIPVFETEDGADSWDPLRLEAALGELRGFSLVLRDGNVVVAHELVLDVVRASLVGGRRYAAFARALWTVAAQMPDRPRESYEWVTAEQILPHALALIASATGDLLSQPTVGVLSHIMSRIAQYFGGRGDFRRASELFSSAMSVLAKHGGVDELAQAGSVAHNFANVIADLGDFEQAEKLHRQALEIKAKALGPNALIVGVSHGALGDCLEHQNKWAESATHYEQALAIYRESGDDAWIANGLVDLAGVAHREGRTEEARSLLRQAVEIADSVSSLPESVSARLRLVELEREEGDLGRAAALAREARMLARARDAPTQAAEATLTQATILAQMGRYEAAAVLVARLAELPEKAVALYPADYAKRLGNFGYALALGGRPDLAIPPLVASQEALESLLPSGHESLTVARLLTAKAMMLHGELDSAADRLQQILASDSADPEPRDEADSLLQALRAEGWTE